MIAPSAPRHAALATADPDDFTSDDPVPAGRDIGKRTDSRRFDAKRFDTKPIDDAVTDAEVTDAALIEAVRRGHLDAYAQLYARHAPAALRLGRALSRHPSDADDLVSETFAKVLATLRGGNGPDLAFRAYLLTTMRHVFYDRARRDRRIEFHEDLTPYETGEPFVDTTLAQLERSYAARAFNKLPERWRVVLWHTEVEGESPAQVAPLLGLTPNGVSALAYRARERLRQMYLQEHISDTGHPSCHWTADRLAGSVRKSLPPRDQAKVDQHLAGCAACHLLCVELAEVNSGLRGVLGPLVLGSAAAGYLKSAALAKAAATVSVGGGAIAGVLDRASAGLIEWLLGPVHTIRRVCGRYSLAKLTAAGVVATTTAIAAAGYLAVHAPSPADGRGGSDVVAAAFDPAALGKTGSVSRAGTGEAPATVGEAMTDLDGRVQPGRARLRPPMSESARLSADTRVKGPLRSGHRAGGFTGGR